MIQILTTMPTSFAVVLPPIGAGHLATLWPQPLAPVGGLGISALFAVIPLAIVLVLMGGLRRSGAFSAAVGLAAAFLLSLVVWRMPADLALLSVGFGVVYALWPIMWMVFSALWLYNLSVETGAFELLRRWMGQHALGDPRIQVILVAFCFSALLEGTAGFGTPVAVAGFLLLGLGFTARQAVTLALVGNTVPVAFGGLGIPIVALAGVTGLNQFKLSLMVGRQLPLLSLILPAYLVWAVGGRKALRDTWPVALVGGASFALAQFATTNYWGPYAADLVCALVSIACVIVFLHFWKPAPYHRAADATLQEQPPAAHVTASESVIAWAPWVLLAVVMGAWTYFHLFGVGQRSLPVPHLHNAIQIELYQRPYAAVFQFQPLAAGTAGLTAVILVALLFLVSPRVLAKSGVKTLMQLRRATLTVGLIVSLAYLYNYSGMTYTLGAALAGLGKFFPLVSGFLGWIACFLTGSDTASNLLFGNLQVAVGHQIGVSPLLLAATNCSGACLGKMISPENIAIGVTTVGLVGHEGEVVRSTFGHSLVLVVLISLLSFVQAYWLPGMVP